MNDLDIVLCSAADVQRWVGNMWGRPFCHAMTRIKLLRPALFVRLTALWEPYLREMEAEGHWRGTHGKR